MQCSILLAELEERGWPSHAERERGRIDAVPRSKVVLQSAEHRHVAFGKTTPEPVDVLPLSLIHI